MKKLLLAFLLIAPLSLKAASVSQPGALPGQQQTWSAPQDFGVIHVDNIIFDSNGSHQSSAPVSGGGGTDLRPTTNTWTGGNTFKGDLRIQSPLPSLFFPNDTTGHGGTLTYGSDDLWLLDSFGGSMSLGADVSLNQVDFVTSKAKYVFDQPIEVPSCVGCGGGLTQTQIQNTTFTVLHASMVVTEFALSDGNFEVKKSSSLNTGDPGYALNMNNTATDRAETTTGVNIPSGSAPWTVEFWANFTQDGSDHVNFSWGGSANADTNAGAVGFNAGTGGCQIHKYGIGSIQGGTVANDGEFHHYEFDYDGSTGYCYEDGILIYSAAIAMAVSSGGYMNIGAQGTRSSKDKVDEVRFSSAALHTGASFTPPLRNSCDVNTVGLWHEDEGSGSNVADDCGLANDLAFTGSPTWVTGNLGSGPGGPSSQDLPPVAVATFTSSGLQVPGVIFEGSGRMTGFISCNSDLDFGNTVPGSFEDQGFTCTGALPGDAISLGYDGDTIVYGGTNVEAYAFEAWTQADAINVRFINNNLISNADPANGTFRVKVIR